MYVCFFDLHRQHTFIGIPQERDGWYTTHAFERIKTVLRHKFFSLLSGHIPSREECEALLVPPEGSTKAISRPTRLRYGKHNMAKGALPPEDVAVSVDLFCYTFSIKLLRSISGATTDSNLGPEGKEFPKGAEMTIKLPSSLYV